MCKHYEKLGEGYMGTLCTIIFCLKVFQKLKGNDKILGEKINRSEYRIGIKWY